MVKVCARPACGAEATARFFFDAASRLVILDARVAEWGGSGILCDDHADRLTPPRGWAIDDRRVLAPRLFQIGRFENPDRPPTPLVPQPSSASPAVSATPAPSRTRRFVSPAAHPSTPLPLDGGPSYALPDEYLTREANRPAEHLTDTAGDDTPLLSRAFEATRTKVRAPSALDALIPHRS